MPQLHQFANQRQYQRVKAKHRAFAMLADWTIKFDIVDISKNGLSFLYLGKAQWFDELSELDIAYEGGQFLKNIPIISISDSTYTNCLIPMRRHSVMFHKLESLQQSRLQHLLLFCNKGSAYPHPLLPHTPKRTQNM